MNYREIIIRMVNANHGLMRNDLSLKVMEFINPSKFNAQEYMDALDSLVLDGELIELPFTTQETINNRLGVRTNGAYFPRGTRFCVPFIYSSYDNFRRI